MRIACAIVGYAALVTSSAMAAASPPDAAQIYKSHCVVCHGADGSGQTAMGKRLNLRDLRSEEVQKAPSAELADVIAEGKGKMAPYKSRLSAAEIAALVEFIKALK